MGELSIIPYFREQRTALPLASGDLTGKTVMVVGSNVGLGLEATVHLANMKPARVIATCRDLDKCEQTRKVIEQRVTGAQSDVISWPLELTSFDSVRVFVDKFEGESDRRIDTLVANASVFKHGFTKTTDGWETSFQVNYLSTALLSILLLPHLVKSSSTSSPSRLVIVSSFGHYLASSCLKGSQEWKNVLEIMGGETLQGNSVDRYNLSKLLQIMFVRELAARLNTPTPVIVTAVNPGLCHSELARDVDSGFFKYILSAVKTVLIARTTEMGSRTLVHAAVAADEHDRHGRYVSSCEVTEESSFLISEEGKILSKRVWGETIEILSQVDPRVVQIVSEYLGSNS
ncbi:short-chain dehydrogenase [Leucogyrophana mollusca]|uniref:Short-chain dehydrogenase n=1 Tax=Leucogyrophana mollusca TaxID=85980 RepID=A0ACB8BCZ1_9AGAM|nr:short-chain dehydrogenase [Leucogyrophana mollusca]